MSVAALDRMSRRDTDVEGYDISSSSCSSVARRPLKICFKAVAPLATAANRIRAVALERCSRLLELLAIVGALVTLLFRPKLMTSGRVGENSFFRSCLAYRRELSVGIVAGLNSSLLLIFRSWLMELRVVLGSDVGLEILVGLFFGKMLDVPSCWSGVGNWISRFKWVDDVVVKVPKVPVEVDRDVVCVWDEVLDSETDVDLYSESDSDTSLMVFE
mmetsp:Transcript_8655/g.18738  ORF Transcript_8655/g.18738 Transcript_8655/m.18738 type:complete len:216 (+) Transcript_8655:188-835(+)